MPEIRMAAMALLSSGKAAEGHVQLHPLHCPEATTNFILVEHHSTQTSSLVRALRTAGLYMEEYPLPHTLNVAFISLSTISS